MTTYSKTDKLESKNTLTEWLKDCTTRETYNHTTEKYEQIPVIRTTVSSVARSGMSRWIKLYITTNKGDLINISYHVARVCGFRYDDYKGCMIGGCGMDMGFAMVYDLAYALNDVLTIGADGYKLKQEWM